MPLEQKFQEKTGCVTKFCRYRKCGDIFKKVVAKVKNAVNMITSNGTVNVTRVSMNVKKNTKYIRMF